MWDLRMQLLVCLLCWKSSLPSFEGIRKEAHSPKFLTSRCCWRSIFCTYTYVVCRRKRVS
jgi:hypothetical protein